MYCTLPSFDLRRRPTHPVQEDDDNSPPNLSVSRPRCSSRRPPSLRQHDSTDLACALPLPRHFCLLNRREDDVGITPAHRLYDHQKCMRTLGQNASARTLVHWSMITTDGCDTSRPTGRGKWRADPARATNEPTRATLKLTAAGGGRLRQDASGGRRGADPPHEDVATRSACCTAPALGVTSPSDEPWHNERKERQPTLARGWSSWR